MSAADRERLDQALARFGQVPANRWLGLRLVSCRPGGAEIAMPVRAEFLQEGGVVHGGIVGALADSCAAYGLVHSLNEGQTMTGVEFKLNFLRPAVLGKGDLVARCRVANRGRRLGVCEVEVAQDGRAVARGLFTFLFLNRPDD